MKTLPVITMSRLTISQQPLRTIACLLLYILVAGCSGTPSRSPQENADVRHAGQPPAAEIPGSLAAAQAMLGTPYRFGGASPRGFDCSGLVYYAFRHVGIRVPRTTAAQYRYSRPIDSASARPGDLVFFKLTRRQVSHVGIYTGNGQFIHAPSRGGQVSYASLANPYWQQRVVAFRRLH